MNKKTCAILAIVCCGSFAWFAHRRVVTHTIITNLSDPNSVTRERAILELRDCGRVESALPELANCLGDPDRHVRELATRAFNDLGDPGVAYLEKALVDPNPQAKIAALKACDHSNPKCDRKFSSTSDQRLFGSVATCMKDENARVRVQAITTFPQICFGAARENDGVMLLSVFLNDGNSLVRASAAQAIGKVARKVTAPVQMKKIISALAARLQDDDMGVRLEAAWALGRSEGLASEAAPALAYVLAFDNDSQVRHSAGDSLLMIEADLPTTTSLLFKYYREKQQNVDRLTVMRTLWRLSRPLPVWAIPFLIDALNDELEDVRVTAIWALGDFGKSANAALPGLKGALVNASPKVQVAIAGSLWEIDQNVNEVMPLLLQTINDPNPGVRTATVRILGKQGADAQSVLPLLMRLENTDQDSHVRLEASGAIRLIKQSR